MDYNENFDKKVALSEFNEAVYQIARLNVLWSICNTLASSGKLTEWKWKLDRIWIELSADAKQKDGKELWDIYLSKDYKDFSERNKNSYLARLKLINENIAKAKTREELYNTLQEKEIFLRTLQDDVGKGSKKRMEFEEDWD